MNTACRKVRRLLPGSELYGFEFSTILLERWDVSVRFNHQRAAAFQQLSQMSSQGKRAQKPEAANDL
jgi:hypothetical protein